MRPAVLALLLALAGPALAGEAMLVASPAFHHRGPIPIVYTCYGDDVSPPLFIGGTPEGTVSLALIMADPDAPVSALGPLGLVNFTHWLVWDVPVDAGAATFPEDGLPAGAVQGAGYRGPCPPVPGDPHRYHFEVHALDSTLGLGAGATRAELEDAMQGHVLATSTLIGVFARPLPGP